MLRNAMLSLIGGEMASLWTHREQRGALKTVREQVRLRLTRVFAVSRI